MFVHPYLRPEIFRYYSLLEILIHTGNVDIFYYAFTTTRHIKKCISRLILYSIKLYIIWLVCVLSGVALRRLRTVSFKVFTVSLWLFGPRLEIGSRMSWSHDPSEILDILQLMWPKQTNFQFGKQQVLNLVFWTLEGPIWIALTSVAQVFIVKPKSN